MLLQRLPRKAEPCENEDLAGSQSCSAAEDHLHLLLQWYVGLPPCTSAKWMLSMWQDELMTLPSFAPLHPTWSDESKWANFTSLAVGTSHEYSPDPTLNP